MNNIWKGAWKKLSFRWATRFLFFVGFIAIFSPFIANEQPLAICNQREIQLPVLQDLLKSNSGLSSNINWKTQNDGVVIFSLIPYSAGKGDYANADYRSPFSNQKMVANQNEEIELPWRFRHWLGTDLRGADVLAGIINGAGISLSIGFLSALLALLVGLIIGGTAGWLKEFGLELSIGYCLSMFIFSFFLCQLFFTDGIIMNASLLSKTAIVLLALYTFLKFGKLLSHYHLFSYKIKIPIDVIVLRMIEIFSSFPKIVLILVFAGFFNASIGLLIFLFVFTGWPDFARIIRAEFIRQSKFNFIEAARLSGASNIRIVLRHILPNTFVPIMVIFVYAIAAYMLIEAGLSFLGVGVPPAEVTWGSLMASGKDNLNAWWLILFPGTILSLTIASFHTVAEGLQKQLTK